MRFQPNIEHPSDIFLYNCRHTASVTSVTEQATDKTKQPAEKCFVQSKACWLFSDSRSHAFCLMDELELCFTQNSPAAWKTYHCVEDILQRYQSQKSLNLRHPERGYPRCLGAAGCPPHLHTYNLKCRHGGLPFNDGKWWRNFQGCLVECIESLFNEF